jgi:pectin methylesterase-like acyl-CoA thioesterase
VITDHPPVQVIGFPVNLSAALTMPTTTRSAHGLTKLTTAFDAVSSNGAAALDGVTSKGFTNFAPVDDAWTGEASTQANDSKVAPTMLGNHVSGEVVLESGWSR